MIAAEEGEAVAASYDVTSSAQCAAMVEDTVSRWGRLDCLDNNVGIGCNKLRGSRPGVYADGLLSWHDGASA